MPASASGMGPHCHKRAIRHVAAVQKTWHWWYALLAMGNVGRGRGGIMTWDQAWERSRNNKVSTISYSNSWALLRHRARDSNLSSPIESAGTLPMLRWQKSLTPVEAALALLDCSMGLLLGLDCKPVLFFSAPFFQKPQPKKWLPVQFTLTVPQVVKYVEECLAA